MAAASPTGGGNNIRDGIYRFLIERFFLNSGHSGDSVIAELRVVEAVANGAADDKGHPVVPNTVGSTCSMVCNITKHEAAAGNAKAFAIAAVASLGMGWDEFKAAFPDAEGKPSEELALAFLCGEANPLRGVAISDETYRGVNKGRSNPANRGLPLTLNKWRPLAQTEAEILAQRAHLDSSTAKADLGAAAQAPPTAPTTASSAAPPPVTPPPVAPQGPVSGVLRGILGRK